MRVRLLLFIALSLVAVVTLFLLLLATDTALSVWQRLREAPLWLQAAYTVFLSLVASATLWIAWRWLKPAPKKTPNMDQPLDPVSLQEQLIESAGEGVDVSAAVEEIREQQRRRRSGEVYIAVFGEISTGKSSLVKALLETDGGLTIFCDLDRLLPETDPFDRQITIGFGCFLELLQAVGSFVDLQAESTKQADGESTVDGVVVGHENTPASPGLDGPGGRGEFVDERLHGEGGVGRADVGTY